MAGWAAGTQFGGREVSAITASMDQPVVHPMGVGKLVCEPRFAHPSLAHEGDYLPPARTGLIEDPAQMFDLGIASHEPREAPERRGLQASARLPRSRQLEDL